MKKENFEPLVTIIIPVYNGENYVREAIDSALAQSYKNIEVLVVNDGSKDSTDDICKSYKDQITYIPKKNGGVASALNLGIKSAKGEYVSWLSHDDLYTPDKIKNEIEALAKSKNKKIPVSCAYYVINAGGEKIADFESELLTESGIYSGLKLLFSGTIHGCALLLHKSIFEKYGMFDENLPTTQDYDMWFRIFRNEDVLFTMTEDMISRSHDEQGSKVMLSAHVEECNTLWIKMISSLTEKEIKKAYDSKLSFYEIILDFLRTHTAYDKAIDYLEMLTMKERIVSLNNEENIEKLNEWHIDVTQNLIKKSTNGKKNIVIGNYGDWQDMGGLNRVVANISNGLADTYNIYIISSNGPDGGYPLNKNVNYINMDSSALDFNTWNEAVVFLNLVLNANIYIGTYNCSYQHIQIFEHLKKYDIKVIAWNHEFYFLPYNKIDFAAAVKVRNDIFKKIDIALWLTNASNRAYGKFNDNGLVMPNALTVSSGKIDKKDKKRNLVTVGRFDDPRKELETALRVLALVLKKAPDTILYVAGKYDLDLKCKNSDKTIGELIDELKIPAKNLQFLGFVKDVKEVYAKGCINLVTSYHEGFGLIITEAAVCGLPTVAFNDTGFEDLIVNGETGLLYNRDNLEEMSDGIVDLLLDCEKTNNMAVKTQEYSERFAYDKIIDRWKTVIDLVCLNDDNKKLNEFIAKENNYNDDPFVRNSFKEYENSIKILLEAKEKEFNTLNEYVNVLLRENKELKNSFFRRILRFGKRVVKKLLGR
ncbi:MAG: glycosyltransferase [Firmicutes bacterium]|nr:glycosyltransferase [Bacillota bacterium]